jgi:hypothetical protein
MQTVKNYFYVSYHPFSLCITQPVLISLPLTNWTCLKLILATSSAQTENHFVHSSLHRLNCRDEAMRVDNAVRLFYLQACLSSSPQDPVTGSLSWARSVQSIQSEPVAFRIHFFLFFRLRLRFLVVDFHKVSVPKLCIHFWPLCSYWCYMSWPPHPPQFDYSNNICRGV